MPKATEQEIDREIALFIIAHRSFKAGKTYRIVSSLCDATKKVR